MIVRRFGRCFWWCAECAVFLSYIHVILLNAQCTAGDREYRFIGEITAGRALNFLRAVRFSRSQFLINFTSETGFREHSTMRIE